MERELIAALRPLGAPVVWGVFSRDVGYPRLTLQRISTRSAHALDRRMGNETARVQINVLAQSYAGTAALSRRVSQTLTELRGGSVIRCYEISRRDSFEQTGGDVIRLQMLDVLVRYRA
ncbi:tail completion protein gp17 [Antarcticimicrobium luteum]|uniref:DUF3168 domain-containing protein n=1 Tax=Antarcticimicrobium luteum TaxID=2547397 RepID=A0A4R5VH05_9RHOB|nr:DUF3168 domain-containing protein [Antarcticimicrobium luteum]TDK51139.1 DUF3168 domain-containing protein [Antarcticimicrobium luteum]